MRNVPIAVESNIFHTATCCFGGLGNRHFQSFEKKVARRRRRKWIESKWITVSHGPCATGCFGLKWSSTSSTAATISLHRLWWVYFRFRFSFVAVKSLEINGHYLPGNRVTEKFYFVRSNNPNCEKPFGFGNLIDRYAKYSSIWYTYCTLTVVTIVELNRNRIVNASWSGSRPEETLSHVWTYKFRYLHFSFLPLVELSPRLLPTEQKSALELVWYQLIKRLHFLSAFRLAYHRRRVDAVQWSVAKWWCSSSLVTACWQCSWASSWLNSFVVSIMGWYKKW